MIQRNNISLFQNNILKLFPTVIISQKSILNTRYIYPIKHSKTTNLNSKQIIKLLTSIKKLKKSNQKDLFNKHRPLSNNNKKTSIKIRDKIRNTRKLEKNILTKKIKAFNSFQRIFIKPDKKKFKDIEKRNQRETGNVEYFMRRERNSLVEGKGFKEDFKGNIVNSKRRRMKK